MSSKRPRCEEESGVTTEPCDPTLPDRVRQSAEDVMAVAASCTGGGAASAYIDVAALEAEVDEHPELYREDRLPPSWQQAYHFFDAKRPELTAQYVLVLDALNFCFWPLAGYEYEHLAGSLRAVAEADAGAFGADSLAAMTSERLTSWLRVRPDQCIPLVEERARLLREVGRVLDRHFGGQAANLVRQAGGSACELVRLVTAHFPGFRDEAVFRGRQVCFYKRAQIFVGDVWGAFGGAGLGCFPDIDRLTCFADYRIPQLLQSLGILRYSRELEARVASMLPVEAGSDAEVQIRAATVLAVERIRERLATTRGIKLHAVQLDWLLWERGEASLSQLRPHHRTLTVFY